MSFIKFLHNHIDNINNYVQPAILWREGRFASPVAKVEAAGGDFAEIVKSLPASLSREDVAEFFREDPYKGFVASIMWSGISRFQAEGIARNNNRSTAMPKLESLSALLSSPKTDRERIEEAVASLRSGGENCFYGIGPGHFTELLYFLAYDMDFAVRPLIYDENMKPAHFALMPEAGQNPYWYYFPEDEEMPFASDETGQVTFEDVYFMYCELMCETACELGADVKNLEAWISGRSGDVNSKMPNPRTVARIEVDRMQCTGFVMVSCGIENLFDAIGASRIFYDNNIDLFDLLLRNDGALNIGKDEKRPIVIAETEGYIHLEYVVSEVLSRLKNLESKLISQQLISVGDRRLDRLCFEVKSGKDAEPEDMEVYFDITAGYKAV